MDTQQRVAASYESAAADFSRFDERLLPGEEASRDIYVAAGSD